MRKCYVAAARDAVAGAAARRPQTGKEPTKEKEPTKGKEPT
jgi:hypothetical protein